ncbi:MAG: serine/threonine-protein kinase [Candidatus Aminicenantes bacterium]|nr:serine/threonine-protein kinase [Candidatus Aminicenantes bacterium]
MNPKTFQRVKEIFEAALDHDSESREDFVRRECSPDTELTREVLSLLSHHHPETTFLDGNLLQPSAVETAASHLAEGDTLGPYRILGEVGRGGMGVVYRAVDTRLDRMVALKAISPLVGRDVEQRRRLRREAKVAASLNHSAIAAVYALEELDGGLYIAGEYIEGENLRSRIEQGPLPLPELLRMATQVCQGLVAAHSTGVVHRDLKPENVLLDAQGNPKIVDFGLALPTLESSHSQRLTQEGTVLGTPAYMSPEQLEGQEADFRSDLFSFGMLLYELATGRHPFEGKTPLVTVARILEGRPGRSDAMGPPSMLEPILVRCLEKDPDDRFQSTEELLAQVQRLESKITGRPKDTLGSRASLHGGWWIFHQSAVVLFYALMVFGAWKFKQAASPAPVATALPLALFFLVLGCALCNGTIRTHLLFTARFNRSAIDAELNRVRGWKRRVDGLFSLCLLLGAALIVNQEQLLAGCLAAVAVSYTVVFLLVEPATERAVFEPDTAAVPSSTDRSS